MSKTPTVKLRIDPDNPPKLTSRQIAMLEELDKKPDSEVDYSNIPPHRFTHSAAGGDSGCSTVISGSKDKR